MWLSNVIKYGPVGLIISLTPNHLLKDMFPTCLWTGAPVRHKKQLGCVGMPEKLAGGKDFPCHKRKMSERKNTKATKRSESQSSLPLCLFLGSARAESRASNTKGKCSTSVAYYSSEF